MNERIRELARQAGGIDMTNNLAGGVTTWVGTGSPEFLEKFAELIIAECCVTADANIDDTKYPSYWIKKKFGVEE